MIVLTAHFIKKVTNSCTLCSNKIRHICEQIKTKVIKNMATPKIGLKEAYMIEVRTMFSIATWSNCVKTICKETSHFILEIKKYMPGN